VAVGALAAQVTGVLGGTRLEEGNGAGGGGKGSFKLSSILQEEEGP
jgi:hypothetical protein